LSLPLNPFPLAPAEPLHPELLPLSVRTFARELRDHICRVIGVPSVFASFAART
jgi:hypothetical protein